MENPPNMSNVMDQIVAAQDQAFELIEKMQQPIVEPVSKLVAAIGENAPQVPFADFFPSPAEVLRNQFAVAERMLNLSRSFTFGVLGETPAQ